MAVHYKTQGVIIKKKDVGEANRIFTVFTLEFGKVSLWAVSERKINSKLRGGVEQFSLSQLEFVEGKNKMVLIEAVCQDQRSFIKKDLLKLQASHRMCELLDKLTPEGQKDEALWNLLENSFFSLGEQGSPKKVYEQFENRILELAGYAGIYLQ